MDDDSCGKFIGSLTKYLQSLCHSYVDFDAGVELVGHIYLNVDTGKKIDYVLNESVCKNGANVVKFTSNSYHAQPVEKQKKETPKKDPPKESEKKKKNDEDDVIIVGTEGGRRNRQQQQQGASPSRSQGQHGHMQQRGAAVGHQGQNRMGPAQGGLFRQPRGPNPRLGGPVPRPGGYTYQPRQRLTYPGQPRNFLNVGPGYNPRMRQPHYPQPRGAQPQGVRSMNPVDNDVTFMREEYVAGQPNNRAGAQPGVTMPGQQPGYPYPPHQVAPHHQQQQPPHMAPQRYMPPYTQSGQPTTMSGPLTAGPSTSMGVAMTAGQPTSMSTAGQPMNMMAGQGQEGSMAGAAPTSTIPSIFHSTAQPVSVSGGMPLPVTTHTIFDSGPVMSTDMSVTVQQPAGGEIPPAGTDPLAIAMTAAGVGAPSATSGAAPSTTGAPMNTSQPGLLIGQVWSESAAAPEAGAQSQPVSGSTLPYPQTPPTVSTPTAGPLSSPLPTTSTAGHSGNVFDVFNQHPPPTTTQPHGMPPTSQPQPFSSQFSPSHTQTGAVSQNSAGGSGEGGEFSALVSELQAFNQQPGTQAPGNNTHHPHGTSSSTHPTSTSNAYPHGTSPHHPHGTSPHHPHGTSPHHPHGTSPHHPHGSSPHHPHGTSTYPTTSSAYPPGASTYPPSSSYPPASSSQAPSNSSLPPPGSSHGYPSQSHRGGTPTDDRANSYPMPGGDYRHRTVKKDPGDIEVNMATNVIHESTEAAASEASETFLAPQGMGGHGGLEAYRKRSGSASSHSRGTPSPSSASLVGPESVVIETKPFLQHISSDYDSGCDTASASTGDRLTSPQGAPLSGSQSHMRPLSIPLVPVDSPSSSTKSVDVKQERPSVDEPDSETTESVRTAETEWTPRGPESDWVTDMSALGNSEDSMESESDTAQDDDDPNYTPGRPIDSEKGIGKRTRGKHPEKGQKGKRRRTDAPDSEDGGEEHQSVNTEGATGEEEEEEGPQLPYLSPPPPPDPESEQSEQHHEDDGDDRDGSPETMYKPGSFILINSYKDSERSSRTRPTHVPAEVIVTPSRETDGVWVHTLAPAGNGLWRLPSIDQLADMRVEPDDIVKILDRANVRIIGAKVFYKFDDMAKGKVGKVKSTPKKVRKNQLNK
ncbi:hypothetical protein V1264_015563 [Littorina saxatilis]|uniref:Uncharacterized protein n=1 Tax=Littorina saxatilis TaxID=31220 RepID=A0AAN9BJX8_9CAEN